MYEIGDIIKIIDEPPISFCYNAVRLVSNSGPIDFEYTWSRDMDKYCSLASAITLVIYDENEDWEPTYLLEIDGGHHYWSGEYFKGLAPSCIKQDFDAADKSSLSDFILGVTP